MSIFYEIMDQFAPYIAALGCGDADVPESLEAVNTFLVSVEEDYPQMVEENRHYLWE